MARLVLGIGTSHTPMLLTPPEAWPEYESRDRKMELLDRKGERRSFEELEAEAGPEVREALTPKARERAYQACQESLDRLARALEETAPDVLLVVGDDQKELFQEENLPAILIYWGDSIVNKLREAKPGEPAWWSEALANYYGRESDESCPVDAELARHLIASLIEDGFDVAQSTSLPDGRGEGHAFAFIHSRLLRHRPVPVIPIFLNTYYPPNQPTPDRCYLLGRSLREALQSSPREARVGIVASGGLSHFVIDTELDRKVLTALRDKDAATLRSLPTELLNSGTSEIRNWITMFGAIQHLEHRWTEYVPAYRTAAGTGTGCGFGLWKAPTA